MRRRHGGRRARVRGTTRVGADFALLAAAVNLARLGALGLRRATGQGWEIMPAMSWKALLEHRFRAIPPSPDQTVARQPTEPVITRTSRHNKHNRSVVTTYPTNLVRHNHPGRPRSSQSSAHRQR